MYVCMYVCMNVCNTLAPLPSLSSRPPAPLLIINPQPTNNCTYIAFYSHDMEKTVYFEIALKFKRLFLRSNER